MRHLWSLIAGLVITPLTLVLLAYADGSLVSLETGYSRDRLAAPLAIMVVAAILAATIASLRVSPLGPLVAGLTLISLSALAFFAPAETIEALPATLPDVSDLEGNLFLPLINGQALIIGVILAFSVFSAGRWRRWPQPAPDPMAGPVDPMVDTGRIEAIKGWSPAEEPTAANPTAEIPASTGVPAPVATPPGSAAPVAASSFNTPPASAAPQVSTPPVAAPPAQSGGRHYATDNDSPWATPPTGR